MAKVGKGLFEWMLEGMESRSRNREKRQRDGKDPGNKFVVIINVATFKVQFSSR